MKRHDANGESASPQSSVAPAVPTTGHFDVNAAYAAAAKCEHLLQGVCLTCVGVSLAAAEERGRRRGIEERDELRALLGEWQPTLCARKPWPQILAPDACGKCLGCRTRAALAPRDSTPADDYCATCNSIRGTHQAWCDRKPRDSAPRRHVWKCDPTKSAVACAGPIGDVHCPCWCHVAPRDSGKGFSNANEPFADLVAAKDRK